VYERRRARILLALFTLAALAFVTIDARAGEQNPLDRVRDGVGTLFGPLQDGVAATLRPVTALVDEVRDLARLRTDNAALRAALEEERQRQRAVADVLRENERLRALLDIRSDLVGRSDEFEIRAAHVIALAPSNFEWTVTIDVGERDGIEPNMPVITGEGLVGRVVQVGPRASRVLLAVDSNFSAAVRVARSGEHGYIEGGGTEPFRLTLIDPEADVAPGDEIVTSTYANALFPDGLPVGRVASVEGDLGLLQRHVLVRPFVDFTRLDRVLVILRAPPPDDAAIPVPGTTRQRSLVDGEHQLRGPVSDEVDP
jgi:rod shape-determining protein MreC